jgi:hypothetical protein
MDEEARSAKAYKARADQLRAEAENTKNPETKEALLRIAADYEQLSKSVLSRSSNKI